MNRRKLANRAAWWTSAPLTPLLARRFPTLAAMVEQRTSAPLTPLLARRFPTLAAMVEQARRDWRRIRDA